MGFQFKIKAMKHIEPPLLPQNMNSLHQIEIIQRNQVRKRTFIAMNDEIEALKIRISENREGGSRRREEIRVWCFEKVRKMGLKPVWTDFASPNPGFRVAKPENPKNKNPNFNFRVAKKNPSRREVRKFYLVLNRTDFASPNLESGEREIFLFPISQKSHSTSDLLESGFYPFRMVT